MTDPQAAVRKGKYVPTVEMLLPEAPTGSVPGLQAPAYRAKLAIALSTARAARAKGQCLGKGYIA